MKRIERHHLKENELATTLAGIGHVVDTRRRQLLYGAAALLAIVVVALGFSAWRQRQQSRGQELLAEAMVALNARVVPAGAAGPEGDAPAAAQIGATGSFSTEEAKLNAALPKLKAAADAAPVEPGGADRALSPGGRARRPRPPRRRDRGVRRRGAPRRRRRASTGAWRGWEGRRAGCAPASSTRRSRRGRS